MGSEARRNLWAIFALMFIILTSGYVRLNGLSDYAFTSDEMTYFGISAGKTLREVWRYAHFELNPPAIYYLMYYWKCVSDNPRHLMLLLGTLLIIVYYFIGRQQGGHMLGLCCAALVGFSNSCIIQSTIVRQYMAMVLMLSLGYYLWQLWRTQAKPVYLLLYVLAGLAAVFCHFSAMLCITVIAAYEGLGLLRAKRIGRAFVWSIVNGLILLAGVLLYIEWSPIQEPLKAYFLKYNYTPSERALYTLAYPFAITGYILPDMLSGIFSMLAGLWLVWRKRGFLKSNPAMSGALVLAGFGLAFGMFLFASGIYPPFATRRNVWLLPLILPAAAWLLNALLDYLCSLLAPQRVYGAAMLLPLAIALLYSKDARFSDGSEYVQKQAEKEQALAYLGTLTANDIIITEKDDAVFLMNPYPLLTLDASVSIASQPYLNTTLATNPYYPRFYNREILLSTLRKAQDKGLLENKDRVVFFRMVWSRSPVADLMLCPQLNKQLKSFSVSYKNKDENALLRDDILRTAIMVMELDTKELTEKLLNADGTALQCLDGKHDMAPPSFIN